MLCEDKFLEIYGRTPDGISFSPYRICPIGAHSDHNLGKITGLAIDQGIHIAFRPKNNGVIEMVPSGTFGKSAIRPGTGRITFGGPPGRWPKSMRLPWACAA